MSVGKILLQPGKFRPMIGQNRSQEAEWVIELFTRLAVEWAKGGKFQQAVEAEGAVVLDHFLTANQQSIDRAVQHFRQWIAPGEAAFTRFAEGLAAKEGLEEIEFVLETLDNLLDGLSKDNIAQSLEAFFDIVEQELGQAVRGLKDQVLLPLLDGLIHRLEADFRQGATDEEAFNCFMIANRIRQLRDLMLRTDLDLPTLDKKVLLKPLLDLLATARYEEIRLRAKGYLATTRSLSDKIQCLADLRLNVQVQAGVSPRGAARRDAAAPEELPERMLWYANWLLGSEYRMKGNKVFQEKLEYLFSGDGDHRQDLNNSFLPDKLRALFGGSQPTLPTNIDIEVVQPGLVWYLHIEDKDPVLFTLTWENDAVQVYRKEVYMTDDWSQIKPLQNYTFGKISPNTADKLVFHTLWASNVAESILHFVSMEPTSEVPGNSDMFSNLSNALTQLTYGGLRLSGTSAFGWRKKDFDPNFLLRWVVPVGATFLTSFEGIHTNKDSPCSTRTVFWATLFGADLTEMVLYRHWLWSVREAMFSIVTLLNHKDIPGSNTDKPHPLNLEKRLGVVLVFVDWFTWIGTLIHPRKYFGFPPSAIWAWILGFLVFWLGLGSALGFVGGFFGNMIAHGFSGAKVRELFKKWWLWIIFPVIKYPFYLYISKDGDTRGGTYLARGKIGTDFTESFSLPGYKEPSNSPYRLPYHKDTVSQCAQGNLGAWSHTPHSFESQVYAFDFALNFKDDVLAMRPGVLISFEENIPDSQCKDSAGNKPANEIVILHIFSEGHDFDKDGNKRPTVGSYLHGAKGSISPLFTPKIGLGEGLDNALNAAFPGASDVTWDTTTIDGIKANLKGALEAELKTNWKGLWVAALNGLDTILNAVFNTSTGTLSITDLKTQLLSSLEPLIGVSMTRANVLDDQLNNTLTTSISWNQTTIDTVKANLKSTIVTMLNNDVWAEITKLAIEDANLDTILEKNIFINQVGTLSAVALKAALKTALVPLIGFSSFYVAENSSGNQVALVRINRGDVIMGAGDTGNSAYNHLHVHVKPAGIQADYSIPFVFGDVGGNGVPKSLNYYKSGNDA